MTKLSVSRVTPTMPPPEAGEEITVTVPGLPPKQHRVPVGSSRQSHHKRFKLLREHVIEVMGGRAPSAGPVGITLLLPPKVERSESGLNDDYGWTVVDSVTACWGDEFWHDPIVCYLRSQITSLRVGEQEAGTESYTVLFKFLG